MYARISTYHGSAARFDDDVRDVREQILPELQEIPGFLGIYVLLDRERDTSLSITLWENEAAMRASEAAANRIREDSAVRHEERIVKVERYEVAMAPSPERLRAR